METEDFLSFEVLEDPEMSYIGQRLIAQAGELLDDTDLNDRERGKVEKVISDCWDQLSATKAFKDTFLKVSEDYRDGKPVPSKKNLGLDEHFKDFLAHAVKVLNGLVRMLAPLTQNQIVCRSYLRQGHHILESLDRLQGISRERSHELAQVIQRGESLWIGALAKVHHEIQENRNRGGFLIFHKGAPLPNGKPALEITLPDGRLAQKTLIEIWEHLVDFCEDFVAYAIGLRFLEIIQGMEVIPKKEQDPVYPRRFRTMVRGACPENDGTPPPGERPGRKP